MLTSKDGKSHMNQHSKILFSGYNKINFFKKRPIKLLHISIYKFTF